MNRKIYILVAVCFLVLLGLSVPFLISLKGASHGETAGALGSVIGGAIGGILAAYAAYIAVRETLQGQSDADIKKDVEELATIRLALRTEVALVAQQCWLEYQAWKQTRDTPDSSKHPRTAFLPPLTIYKQNASNIGRLTREEIVPLISFACTHADINVVAHGMAPSSQSIEDLRALTQLFSNACQNAADCLLVIPAPDAKKDQPFINALRIVGQGEAEERASAAKLTVFHPASKILQPRRGHNMANAAPLLYAPTTSSCTSTLPRVAWL